MTLAESGTSPGATTGTGTNPTITSASFTPPAGSLLVARVCGEWSHGPCTVSILDSVDPTGDSWELVARATGTSTTDGGVAAVYIQWVAVSAAMTVTAEFGNLGGGRTLDVRVVTGADPSQSPATGWAQVRTTLATANGELTVTTTETGSLVYGISNEPTQSNALVVLSGTVSQGGHVNTVDSAGVGLWRYTTSSPAATVMGGTWATAGQGNVAAFEVLPLGGTISAPGLPTFVDGTVPTAADLNALGSNLRNLAQVTTGGVRYAPYVPGGRLAIKPLTVLGITNPNFVIADSTLTQMRWDTVYANSDNAWTVLDPYTIYINTAGLYRVHFVMQAISTGTGLIEAYILANGSTPSSNAIAGANSYGTSCGASASLELPLGATLTSLGYQASGADATMGATQFVCEYLGS